MSQLYPLRFAPIFRRYLWGGRRLKSVLGKPIDEGDDYAESWEIVDHRRAQSIITNGELQSRSLQDVMLRLGRELFGRHAPLSQFPLLFKFLDAHDNLSVQVHPNDAQAAEMDPPDLGKTEAWVVIHADPGSVIYAGLKHGVDRATLEHAVQHGTTAQCLHRLEPQAGDCVFIPAGTVHAVGAGLVIAEIQQASDTTFRLFDWNRVGPDGKPRPLHVEQSLNVIDYDRGPVTPQSPEPADRQPFARLVKCEKFVLDRWRLEQTEVLGGDDRCHIVTVLDGQMTIQGETLPLVKGQTVLLPACLGQVAMDPSGACDLLDMYLP